MRLGARGPLWAESAVASRDAGGACPGDPTLRERRMRSRPRLMYVLHEKMRIERRPTDDTGYIHSSRVGPRPHKGHAEPLAELGQVAADGK